MQEKADYLLQLFQVPLLNENRRLAILFCDEMIAEWMNEGGRKAKQTFWKGVKSILQTPTQNK